jgi:hypothetical protein
MSHAHTGAAFAGGPTHAAGGLDPAGRSGYDGHPPRMGLFTDTSVCIGCKACEVARGSRRIRKPWPRGPCADELEVVRQGAQRAGFGGQPVGEGVNVYLSASCDAGLLDERQQTFGCGCSTGRSR